MAEDTTTPSTDDFLIPLDNYLKVGLHIGTKFRTKYMEPFIYKIRSDGLAVLNVKKIDERIEIASKFLSQFEPNEILVACRRENGWKAVKLFSKLTGVRVIAGRYRPGMLTNPNLDNFSETKVLFVVDPWPDKMHTAQLCEKIQNEFFIVPHHSTRSGKHGEIPGRCCPAVV